MKVSVVIPTYNRAAYLKATLESVLAQTYKDIEVIVVDDSSTDETARIVSSFGSKVKYILQDNRERGAARNNGIRNSAGDYIAFLDSDDLWLADHLESCVKTLESSPEIGLSFSGSYMADENGKVISKMPVRRFGPHPLRQIVSGYSSGGCNASSCVIRRGIFDRAGFFSEIRELSGSEDWEMWARIAGCCRLIFSGVYTVKIRFHPGKSSIDAERMAASMKMALDMTYANDKLLPVIKDIKSRAYSRLYTVTAINCYAAGKMAQARKYIAEAIKSSPSSVLTDRYLLYTYARSLLGGALSSNLRKIKYLMKDLEH